MPDETQRLVDAIAGVGTAHPSHPQLAEVEPLRHFFLDNGSLDRAHLDERDGSCTRREILLRFLVLNAVMDQGPEMVGVRMLLNQVTNQLYRSEVRFLHKPVAFFQELGIAINRILEQHQSIKAVRASIWAEENQTHPEKYNLFMDNSRQVLNYAVFRWGVPLALPLLLEKDAADPDRRATALVDYLESWKSAEEMSEQLKCNERRGLGKAIGDKACHLFAKWMVSSFRLCRWNADSWGDFSFEVPYDSNAGRVLWRTGYLLRWASEQEYIKWQVVQPGQGKEGNHYIRVTNIRGKGTSQTLPHQLRAIYDEIAVNHLKTHTKKPQKVQIQRIQHAYLRLSFNATGLGVAQFDDGLMHIGTRYCFNHGKPLCAECPVHELCEGHQSQRRLIADYRT
jgi:hypothetical protein